MYRNPVTRALRIAALLAVVLLMSFQSASACRWLRRWHTGCYYPAPVGCYVTPGWTYNVPVYGRWAGGYTVIEPSCGWVSYPYPPPCGQPAPQRVRKTPTEPKEPTGQPTPETPTTPPTPPTPAEESPLYEPPTPAQPETPPQPEVEEPSGFQPALPPAEPPSSDLPPFPAEPAEPSEPAEQPAAPPATPPSDSLDELFGPPPGGNPSAPGTRPPATEGEPAPDASESSTPSVEPSAPQPGTEAPQPDGADTLENLFDSQDTQPTAPPIGNEDGAAESTEEKPADSAADIEGLFDDRPSTPADQPTDAAPSSSPADEPTESLDSLFDNPTPESGSSSPTSEPPPAGQSGDDLDSLFDTPPKTSMSIEPAASPDDEESSVPSGTAQVQSQSTGAERLGFRELDPPAPVATSADNQAEMRPQLRRWTDDTGRYHTVARLVGIANDHIRLLKTNGHYATVPFHRLSAGDLAYVRALIADRTHELTHVASW